MSIGATKATEATKAHPLVASIEGRGLALPVPADFLEAVAARAAELVLERLQAADEDRWVTVDEAAKYLGCPKSRIYALASCQPPRIPVERDGSRLVFKRSELDAWVRAGGGRRP